MDSGLGGKRVLVTGAGQGVGRGVSVSFAEAGAEVFINDVNTERAGTVAAEINESGGIGVPCVFDVTDFDAVSSAVETIGGVDILVNNAGNAGINPITGGAKFAETVPADWEPYIRVNLYGVLHCARAVLPKMIERRWGRLITVVSDAGRTGDINMGAYSAAKAGAAGLTRTLALENGRHGITANNIALGTMRTPMTEALWANPDNPTAKAMLRHYVVRRPGLPGDVAHMALFLASEKAEWITGQTYPVNGGFSFSL